ncbi:hypothetical protein HWV62_22086 [Athelia sp. TMB]|nr:hypothetical protein HWV62_22086 [Athelia sp. TMB]
MSAQTPDPPRRVFGAPGADNSPIEDRAGTPTSERRGLGFGRVSFSQRKPSFISRWRRVQDEENGTGAEASVGEVLERPLIPSALEQKGEPHTTPLPKLSMIVLSIAMLGEFLSANVSTPFLLFMVEGFSEVKDEADVASWTGILVAAFFLTQFVTSLLWATVAQKHGQRAVLFISLLGSAVTVLIFGTCSSLAEAIVIRLLQGIFAGAVGVARGSVIVVTDSSNEGRAYAILGFCWGFGGVAGAIIGGSFESPAKKWPETRLYHIHWQVLSFEATVPPLNFSSGSILSLFLARDAGPREGFIRLLGPEKVENANSTIPEEDEPTSPINMDEEQEPQGIVGALRKKVSKKFSGYFSPGGGDSPDAISPQSVPMATPATTVPRPRAYSRTSRADGSAYGYAGSYRRRLASNNATRRNSNASSMRRRRGSNFNGPESMADTGNLNFAQRLLMANENAVTNIADLWVAAAINVDNDDVFESDSEVGSDAEYDSDIEAPEVEGGASSTPIPSRYSSRLGSEVQRPAVHDRPPNLFGAHPHLSPSSNSRRPSTVHRSGSPAGHRMSPPHADGIPSSRRGSNAFPAIFSHSGVRPPPLVQDFQQMTPRPDDSTDALAPIREGRRSSDSQVSAASTEPVLEKPPSLTSQLPLLIIFQYGLLAVHSTSHDQLFLSYLVSPPRGRFSHLAMFRIGSLLFIPAYLTVTLYRVFASETEDGNFFLMTVTPPHAVGYANGVAQSIVSLCRCFGPVLGGYMWAATTHNNPGGYYIGFFVCTAVASAAIAHSFVIR